MTIFTRLALATALLFTSTVVQAQVSFSHMDWTTNVSGLFLDFDGLTPDSITFGGDYEILNTSVSGQAARPLGSTGNYFVVPRTNTSFASPDTAVINFSTFINGRNTNSLSFLWGSVDSYNTLEVLGLGGNVMDSINGNALASPANGDQGALATNRRLLLTFNTAAASDFSALRFISAGRAFEVDNFAGSFTERSLVPVPEPATYALMSAGLIGLLGVARRRKNA